MDQLPKDFCEFLRRLNVRGVDYLVVGGHAVAYHGYPRYTADLDVWIACRPDNAAKVVAALTDFGFGVVGLSEEMFLDAKRMTRLGREPVRIEILNSVSGIEFEEARSRAIDLDLGDGLVVPLISLADLRKNKKASGRGKDLVDLENLPTEE